MRAVTRALASSGTAVMVAGTLVAATAAYGFQLVVGRALGPEEFAPITVLWTIQFLVFTTVFMPMEQLTIRRLAAAVPDPAPRRLFSVLIAGSVLVAGVFAVLTRTWLLDGHPMYVVVTVVLITAYGLFALGRGALAGHRRFADYGWATMAESVVRLVVAGAILAAGAGAAGVAWSLIPGALVVFLWKPFRDAPTTSAPTQPGAGAALATFVGANAASQTIVAAGPIVVGALGGGPAQVSVFFETFLLFRAPLTVAYSLVARVLPPFTRVAESPERPRLGRWALQIGSATAVLAAAAFGVGAWIGPDLVALFLGAEYTPTASLAAYAVSGVVIATTALFTQQMLIALRATTRLAMAWAGGLVAAVATVMLAGGTPSQRVGLAFLVGEAAALALIVISVAATVRRRD